MLIKKKFLLIYSINSSLLNKVTLRVCDHQTRTLYFKGQKIWEAIIGDLLPKGLGKARKVYILYFPLRGVCFCLFSQLEIYSLLFKLTDYII